MKIGMQIGSYYPIVAGAEVFAQNVAEHLIKEGHEVDVITGCWSKQLKEYDVVNGVDVYRVKMIKIHNLQSLSIILPIAHKTLKLDSEKDYDVIHSHLAFSAAQSGTIVKKFREKKHLITVQGGDLVDYKEVSAKFGGILKPLISWSLRNADLVHAVSTHTERRAIALGARNTIIIPNGVDTEKFKSMSQDRLREKYGFSPDERIIISTSRLTPKNGMDYLIKATAKLLKEDFNLHLIIIGEGYQREELRYLIKKLKIEDKVRILGYIPHEEIPEYLNLSDLFVRPSLDEGFGISFIEAMACQIPVIGTDVGGIPDIIENGKNGFMVAPKNVDELSNAIKKVLEDSSLKMRIAEAGYKTVKEKFTWEIVLKKMDELYKNMGVAAT